MERNVHTSTTRQLRMYRLRRAERHVPACPSDMVVNAVWLFLSASDIGILLFGYCSTADKHEWRWPSGEACVPHSRHPIGFLERGVAIWQ